jgi:hypothetical protein
VENTEQSVFLFSALKKLWTFEYDDGNKQESKFIVLEFTLKPKLLCEAKHHHF